MKRIIAFLLLFVFAAAPLSALADEKYEAIPVKQFAVSDEGTYSDAYLKFRKQLAPEYSGKLYGAKYQAHFALWKKVEGLKTEQDVRKNPKRVMTFPVSGKLAQNADHYVVLNKDGAVVSLEVTAVKIDDITFARSPDRGADRLFVVVTSSGKALVKALVPTRFPTHASGIYNVPALWSESAGDIRNMLDHQENSGGNYELFHHWRTYLSYLPAVWVHTQTETGPPVEA